MDNLPKDCLSHILSFTSPRDVGRSAVVSPILRSAADSDAVWEKFLPSDYQDIISQSSASVSSSLNLLSKKDLYFSLSDHPIIIADGNMSFAIEKKSGKKCYMIGAKGLSIIWGDTPAYWIWTPLKESRFSNVAHLKNVWWLDIKGNIQSKLLSPETTYEVYVVFKLAEFRHGFNERPVNLRVEYKGSEIEGWHTVYLDRPDQQSQEIRGDGWMEIKMGEFFIEHGDDSTVGFTLFAFDGNVRMGGLVVEGIELRPKI